VSLSLTLGRDEKVEHHIKKKKTHRLIVLKGFGLKVMSNFLCWLSCLIVLCLSFQ